MRLVGRFLGVWCCMALGCGVLRAEATTDGRWEHLGDLSLPAMRATGSVSINLDSLRWRRTYYEIWERTVVELDVMRRLGTTARPPPLSDRHTLWAVKCRKGTLAKIIEKGSNSFPPRAEYLDFEKPAPESPGAVLVEIVCAEVKNLAVSSDTAPPRSVAGKKPKRPLPPASRLDLPPSFFEEDPGDDDEPEVEIRHVVRTPLPDAPAAPPPVKPVAEVAVAKPVLDDPPAVAADVANLTTQPDPPAMPVPEVPEIPLPGVADTAATGGVPPPAEVVVPVPVPEPMDPPVLTVTPTLEFRGSNSAVRAAGELMVIGEPTTLRLIARKRYPNNSELRVAFIRQMVAANPGTFPAPDKAADQALAKGRKLNLPQKPPVGTTPSAAASSAAAGSQTGVPAEPAADVEPNTSPESAPPAAELTPVPRTPAPEPPAGEPVAPAVPVAIIVAEPVAPAPPEEKPVPVVEVAPLLPAAALIEALSLPVAAPSTSAPRRPAAGHR